MCVSYGYLDLLGLALQHYPAAPTPGIEVDGARYELGLLASSVRRGESNKYAMLRTSCGCM